MFGEMRRKESSKREGDKQVLTVQEKLKPKFSFRSLEKPQELLPQRCDDKTFSGNGILGKKNMTRF